MAFKDLTNEMVKKSVRYMSAYLRNNLDIDTRKITCFENL